MHSEVLKLNPMTSMYCAPGDVEACGIKNGMPGWHVSEMSHHGTHPPFCNLHCHGKNSTQVMIIL